MSFSFKAWYETNKGRLSEDRKVRYRTDPVYRASIQKANSRVRDQKKLVREELAGVEAQARKISGVPAAVWKMLPVEVPNDDGVGTKVIQVLSIGAVAKVLGRSIQAVRLYEKQGLIPPAPYRSKKGDRLYPPEMIIEIRKSMEKLGRVTDGVIDRTEPPKMYEIRLSTGKVATEPLFRVSAFAKACNRNIASIEHMEFHGLLPKTPLNPVKGKLRLYTTGMLTSAGLVFAAYDSGEIARTDIGKLISDLWLEEGLLTAKVVSQVVTSKQEQTEKMNGQQTG